MKNGNLDSNRLGLNKFWISNREVLLIDFFILFILSSSFSSFFLFKPVRWFDFPCDRTFQLKHAWLCFFSFWIWKFGLLCRLFEFALILCWEYQTPEASSTWASVLTKVTWSKIEEEEEEKKKRLGVLSWKTSTFSFQRSKFN